jgi:hypothetical protein
MGRGSTAFNLRSSPTVPNAPDTFLTFSFRFFSSADEDSSSASVQRYKLNSKSKL